MTPTVSGRPDHASRGWNAPDGRGASTALIVVGYALAAGAGAKLWPVWQQRRVRRFLVFEAGTALVTTGLLLRGKLLPAAANGATALGLGVAWVARDRCSG